MIRKIALSVFLVFSVLAFSQTQIKKIHGIVTDGVEPLSQVSIIVKGTDRGTFSKLNGSYEIYANEGETLVYSYVGKQSMEIIVEDVTEVLNITLYDNIQKLDEVVVTESKNKRKSQKDLFLEYNSNKNLIKTRFGILDKDRVGYSLKVFDGDKFNLAAVDFISVLQSKVPGMIVIREHTYATPVVYLSSMKRLLGQQPIYEVDGNIYIEAPLFIQLNDIKRIAVMGSLAGASKYGTGAAGGVIVINTKTANYSPSEPGTDKPYDLARRRDNYFEEGSTVPISKIPTPQYVAELSSKKNISEALTAYKALQVKYGSSPYFYLDAFSIFSTKFKDTQIAQQIGDEIEQKFKMDPMILKAFAYILEEQEQQQWANEIYKQVFILRPHYGQSYLDLAQSYEDIGAIESSAFLYARYNHLVEDSLISASDTFSEIINRDFGNLLATHGAITGNTAIVKTEDNDFDGMRLLFEWNNSEAEFELQLVGPENQYQRWEHTQLVESERIMEEKIHGFATQEYLIYRPITGHWSVNATYFGNKSLTPTYLKATVFYNYGTKSQTKEVKVFKLTAKNVNQSLFQIKNGSSIATF
ncbi:carboxypeptidase-like regulatory domain-containing protein [Flagellimonas iocasae]|uniref:Carboxypeptidase-like regulatory domain-containing protein n=1 Tax=Flagellimonas iocasae TaxID=2055905 RepID=A0ABW4XTA1_9FLAO